MIPLKIQGETLKKKESIHFIDFGNSPKSKKKESTKINVETNWKGFKGKKKMPSNLTSSFKAMTKKDTLKIFPVERNLELTEKK